MRMYHSSNVSVPHPDTEHSRRYLDFGRGFYLTSLYDQAVRYAQRFKRRGQQAWLNIYELEYNEANWKVRHFDSYDDSFYLYDYDNEEKGDEAKEEETEEEEEEEEEEYEE